MDTKQFRRLEELFARAVSAPPDERGAIVDEATASDPEIGRELARLLEAEPHSALLGSLVEGAGRRLLAGRAAPRQAGGDDAAAAMPVSSSPAAELIARLAARGPTESRYRLDGEIARGGMGVVVRAFDPDTRRVLAMKRALEPGQPTDERRRAHTARFLEEAQITGQLYHPGIVPVHEIGVDARGRPYFTMPLVGGRDLDAIYDLARRGAGGWSTMRVLEVLLKVCDAMAYAHSKGVLHRDLKPANVRVGRFGEVYVMDWGLAKVMDYADAHDPRGGQQAPDKVAALHSIRNEERAVDPTTPLLTVNGTVLGTPAYMSPAQASGDVAALDVRSDVYALGAMLYQLFAGHAPYQDDGETPESQRLWKRVASEPPTPLARRAPSTPPELLAIVERAMARDLAERYSSVAALAEDLRAYTEGRVVGAYETGSWAELRKWIGRNRAFSASLAAAVLAVALGAVAFAVKADEAATAAAAANLARADAEQAAVVAGRNEQAAKRSEAEARASERRAEQVTEFVEKALVGANPYRGGMREYKVTEAMDAAIADIERGSLRDDPETEARLQTTIARVLYGNGRREDALPLAQRALTTRKGLFAGDHDQVAESLGDVALCQMVLGQEENAVPKYEASLAMYQRLHPGDDDRVARALSSLAHCLARMRRGQKGLPLAEAALAMLQRLHPDGKHECVADSLSEIGYCLYYTGDTERALAEYEAALAIDEALFPGDHLRVAHDLLFVAGCYKELNRKDRALPRFEEALGILRKRLGDHDDVAEVLNRMGSCFKPPEALPKYMAALEMLRRLHPDDHPATARSLNYVGLCLLRLGQAEEALPKLQAALVMWRRLDDPDHYVIARSLGNLGSCHQALGHPERALPMFEQAVEILKKQPSPDGAALVVAINNYAGCLMGLFEFEKAQPQFEVALELSQSLHEGDHPVVARALNNLGWCLKEMGKHEEALPKLQAALEMNRRMRDQKGVAVSLGNIGGSLLHLHRAAEALPKFEEALEIQRRRWPDQKDHPDVARALNNVANCQDALHKHKAALAGYRDVLAMREARLPAGHRLLGQSLHNLASCLHEMGHSAEALPYAQRAHEIAMKQPREDPWRQACVTLLGMIRAALK